MFADFVDASFSRIRRTVHDKPHVIHQPLDVIGTVARDLDTPEQLAALRDQIEEILIAIEEISLNAFDRESLTSRARTMLDMATLNPR